MTDAAPLSEEAALRAQIMELVERHWETAHRKTKPFDPASSPVPVSGRVYDASDMKSPGSFGVGLLADHRAA